MTLYYWLSVVIAALTGALLLAGAVFIVRRRQRLKSTPPQGWLTDQMVRQIIEVGSLADGQVPDEALDLEEIAKEEERFWQETWDEPEHYWE